MGDRDPEDGSSPQPDELPPLTTQMRNLSEATVEALRAATKGEPVLAPRAELVRRLGVCAECPRLQRETMRCLDCGCHVRLKARLATGDCPQGLW